VPITQRLALTLDECAALTGFKVCALRSAIWAGELAFIRSGERGRYLIRRESLENFVRSREQREARCRQIFERRELKCRTLRCKASSSMPRRAAS
jgi:excisionase family DNA binding protein